MEKFFNTAGPVRAEDHYIIDPLSRVDLEEVLYLIQQKKYFVLHAPRQTGKTSTLLALREKLNAEDNYHALYINVECAQGYRENVSEALAAITREIVRRVNEGSIFDKKIWSFENKDNDLNAVLSSLSESLDKPLILFIDEIDSLVGDTLITVLRQIRAGYDKRPEHFPQSIILCGVRDVRDYRMSDDSGKSVITGGSAFNIKSESMRVGNFTELDVQTLLHVHTLATGQIFEPDAIDAIWNLTQGQPWLVNALAYEVCFKQKSGRDRSKPITAEAVEDAKYNMILRRETHLDQLVDKLKEERVRRVIEPVLAGDETVENLFMQDIEYVRDLGIISQEKGLKIANPIYREVIPRELIWVKQETLLHETLWYVDANGVLKTHKLLSAFQEFYQENAESWFRHIDYKEAAPQLLLQAFLQRIINGGGRIEREYALGSKRTDLFIKWKLADGSWQKIVMELKVIRKGIDSTIAEGIEQTCDYADRCSAAEQHLIIFDPDFKKAWNEKLGNFTKEHKNKEVIVWTM